MCATEDGPFCAAVRSLHSGCFSRRMRPHAWETVEEGWASDKCRIKSRLKSTWLLCRSLLVPCHTVAQHSFHFYLNSHLLVLLLLRSWPLGKPHHPSGSSPNIFNLGTLFTLTGRVRCFSINILSALDQLCGVLIILYSLPVWSSPLGASWKRHHALSRFIFLGSNIMSAAL